LQGQNTQHVTQHNLITPSISNNCRLPLLQSAEQFNVNVMCHMEFLFVTYEFYIIFLLTN